MDIRFERLVSELGIFGELLLPVAVSRFEGRVRLGYVSPRLIEEVVTDPDTALCQSGSSCAPRGWAVRRARASGSGRSWAATARLPERLRAEGACALHRREAFLFQINKASDAARGASDLLAAIDWIDTYERFIFDAVSARAYRTASSTTSP